jgi:hypothetical protein
MLSGMQTVKACILMAREAATTFVKAAHSTVADKRLEQQECSPPSKHGSFRNDVTRLPSKYLQGKGSTTSAPCQNKLGCPSLQWNTPPSGHIPGYVAGRQQSCNQILPVPEV